MPFNGHSFGIKLHICSNGLWQLDEVLQDQLNSRYSQKFMIIFSWQFVNDRDWLYIYISYVLINVLVVRAG